MAKETYNKGLMPTFFEFMVHLHAKKPEAFSSSSYLRAITAQHWKQLEDPAHCPNCGENMTEYIHKLDFGVALLLKAMGDEVQRRSAKLGSFKEANQVHVVSLPVPDYVRHMTSIARTLGLIAKVKTEDGKHDTKKGWLITSRGYAALRGDRVPAAVTVFRNKIEERTDETTTLDEVFAAADVERRALVGERDITQWVHFAGLHQGEMF